MIEQIIATTIVKFSKQNGIKKDTTTTIKLEEIPLDKYVDAKGEMTGLGYAAFITSSLMGIIHAHLEVTGSKKPELDLLIPLVVEQIIGILKGTTFYT